MLLYTLRQKGDWWIVGQLQAFSCTLCFLPKWKDRESLIKMGGGGWGVSVGSYWYLMKSCVEFYSFIRKDKDTNFPM